MSFSRFVDNDEFSFSTHEISENKKSHKAKWFTGLCIALVSYFLIDWAKEF